MFELHHSDGVVATITTSEGINDVVLSFVYNGYLARTSTGECPVPFEDGVIV